MRWKRLLRAVAIIVPVSFLTSILAERGWLGSFETPILDTWLRLKAPLTAQHTVTVDIDDEDYERLFNETSPLEPETMHYIITAIASRNPRVIGVDLDTSAKKFQAFYYDFETPLSWPSVVWFRGANILTDGIKPFGVWGGRKPPPTYMGVGLLPLDRDGIVRGYRRVIPLSKGGAHASSINTFVDTLPWAIVKVFCGQQSLAPETCRTIHEAVQQPEILHDEFLVPFSRHPSFAPIPASEVLQPTIGEPWRTQAHMEEKIVLLGGTFRVARDEYLTPVGPMAGVELLAQVIESEIQGRLIVRKERFIFWLGILAGFCFSYGLSRFRNRLNWAVLVSLITIVVLPFLCSLIASRSLALWGYFVPVLLAVFIEQLYEKAREAQHILFEHENTHP